jgi:hypothetical protein
MNAERVLNKLRRLSKELRDGHANGLNTNVSLTIDQVRYSQGYVNCLDWVESTLEGLLKETEENDDEL